VSFTVEKDIMVPMRDGVALATDAWVPAGGAPAPVLLVRLPYGKDLIGLYAYGLAPNLFALIEAGYAVVYQDCRGTFRSGGEFTPMLNEAADGPTPCPGCWNSPGATAISAPSGRPTWASCSGPRRPRAAP
jgi:predicted acyl esterase